MKPVILLLDNEADLLQVLSDAIGTTLPAYDVVASTSVEDAESIVDAMHAAHDRELRLVVVDHMLGGRTGLEFIGDLKQRFPHVPSMLFTGQASADVEAQARSYGARVLWKPIRLTAWLGEVRALLGHSAAA